MKNRCSFYFTLLAFILFSCSHLRAAALDYTVPPKPASHIADHAMLFDAAALNMLESKGSMNILRRVQAEPYLLTIQDSYWKDIDTISALVCRAWGICDTDAAALLIMSAGTHPRFRILAGRGAAGQLNDTVISFLEESKLPEMAKVQSPQQVAAFFLKSIKSDVFSRMFNHVEDFDSSAGYAEYHAAEEIADDGKLFQEYNKYRLSYVKTERAKNYDISATKIEWFSFICMAIIAMYLFMWTDYQGKNS